MRCGTRLGYRFEAVRIIPSNWEVMIRETTDQLLYERDHHLKKTALPRPAHHVTLLATTEPTPHPLFTLVGGVVQTWERTGSNLANAT
ncbi:MAG: hypothetical protein HQL86_01790 [Magnetococcales bacterium]|nr:hypothetical protein [Magnetococcales bacterium]